MARRTWIGRAGPLVCLLLPLTLGGPATPLSAMARTGPVARQMGIAAPQYSRLTPSAVVSPRHLPAVRRTAPGMPPGPLPRRQLRPHRTPGLPVFKELRRAQSLTTPRAATSVSGPTLADFAGISFQNEQSAFGSNFGSAPPDPQVAVGDGFVVEMVNTVGGVWLRDGTPVSFTSQNNLFSLGSFFIVPSGYTFTDPWLLFDGESQRWFASGFASQFGTNTSPGPYNSTLYLAVSQTPDPTKLWTIFTVRNNISHRLYDQPKVGISSGIVALSWSDFDWTGTTFNFAGAETSILDKQDLVGCVVPCTVHQAGFLPDVNRFAIVPVHSYSPTTTQYLVYNNADPLSLVQNVQGIATLGVIAVNGRPALGNVSAYEVDPVVAETFKPPPAGQPGTLLDPYLCVSTASAPCIDAGDDRLVTAAWQNGILWAADSDRCAGVAYRSCIRLYQASTAGGTATILQNGSYGQQYSGPDVYYPTVTMDGAGNMFLVFTASGSLAEGLALPATVEILSQPAGCPTCQLLPPSGNGVVAAGTGAYNCSFCGPPPTRWGDYAGSAIDPDIPCAVWVTGEYSAGGGDNWGTAVASYTGTPISVTGVTPRTAAADGTGTVLVRGCGFMGATSVAFGGRAAPSFTVHSAFELAATVPAGRLGPVDVTVTTPAGTSPISSADIFWNGRAPGAPSHFLPWLGLPPAPAPSSIAHPRLLGIHVF